MRLGAWQREALMSTCELLLRAITAEWSTRKQRAQAAMHIRVRDRWKTRRVVAAGGPAWGKGRGGD